jgi:hypothetical protein
MAGDYFIQHWDRHGVAAKIETLFPDFEQLYAAVLEFKKRETDEILKVHLPSHATPAERRKIESLGAQML